FVIDGLSAAAHEHLARRGEKPKQESRLLALELKSGKPIWQTDRDVFGTHLMYSAEHDVLIEGGSQDLRHRLGDEPRSIVARNGSNGEVRWSGGDFTLPGVLRGKMLIPGRAGQARHLLTGEPWQRDRPLLGESGRWKFGRVYGCNTLNASQHLLLFRSGSAACFDLEFDSGTGNFGGFKSGCTANLIPADGVLNALDYTRTCTCSYQHQTSLALIHMPEASHIEAWTRNEGARPDPTGYGVNMGAPGRRVDRASGLTWHPLRGMRRRHPSWITNSGDGVDWVGCSVYEGNVKIKMDDLLAEPYLVRLHFAELEEDVEQGSRLFDVFINGEPVLVRLDVAKEAGGPRRVVVKQFEIESDGVIEVEVRKCDDSQHPPIVSGIEVRTKQQRDGEKLGNVSMPSSQAAR
ncbi:MAG: malectin domain-containing carbohydrate-binding protein, partial [Pirellulales bacterium]